jgi:hypothetical protein
MFFSTQKLLLLFKVQFTTIIARDILIDYILKAFQSVLTELLQNIERNLNWQTANRNNKQTLRNREH